jgi:hypothetical protein
LLGFIGDNMTWDIKNIYEEKVEKKIIKKSFEILEIKFNFQN